MEDVEKRREAALYDFIVGKCQLLPKSYDAASEPIHVHDDQYIFCGSTMEFYIRPLNSSINDIDALMWDGSYLAFAEDFPVLPNDVSRLHDTIECYRMEPYLSFPGFFRLRLWGKMNYSWKYKTYQFNYTPKIIYIYIDMAPSFSEVQYIYTVRGPAVTQMTSSMSLPNDNVRGLWCPQWPKEAQSWPKRPRDYGWPSTATITEVVQQGCHLVYAQHRACKDDVLQWRLSFSVAEVILLQSWTQIQQIVYHMLRFFSERELIQKDCPKEDEVLCSYHLKTLMLWTCEETSPEWWNSSSVIAICCELLQKLSKWLKIRYCPNYFIPEANLFHEPFRLRMLDKTERQLNKFCKSDILCQWFFKKYILPIIIRYDKIEHNGDIYISKCLQSITEYRNTLQSQSLDLLFSLEFAFCNIYNRKSIDQALQPRSILSELSALRKFTLLGDTRMPKLPMPVDDSFFTYFDKTVICLNTAYSLGYGEISWDGELFEYVKGVFMKPKIVRCRYHIFPEPLTAEKSQCQFLRVQELMENLTGTNSRSEFQLLSLMSTEFLRKALECDDSQFNIIAPAALVYLAAIHFAISEYQIVIDLCSAVLLDQTTSVDAETLNAGCLFFVDDIARIVGFCLLCKNVNETIFFIRKHIDLDLRLSANVFAYYLTVTSVDRISKQFEFNPDFPNLAFTFDHFLLAFAKQESFICLKAARKCVYRRAYSVTTKGTLCVDPLTLKEQLIDSLTEYALENVTSFYSMIRKDFGIQCNTADCYRALYLYKCRHHGEVLRFCERILQETDLASDLKKFAFANILVLPPFDSFFDRDVQSLVGLHTLLHFVSPLNDDLRKFKLATHFFHHGMHLSSLLKHYTVRSYHFLGRHFLARYLKLRCYIDCNYRCREVGLLSEFSAMKCSLPFEHIIRRFLRQRCRKIQ